MQAGETRSSGPTRKAFAAVFLERFRTTRAPFSRMNALVKQFSPPAQLCFAARGQASGSEAASLRLIREKTGDREHFGSTKKTARSCAEREKKTFWKKMRPRPFYS
jgi:hypothetical protein